MSNSLRKQIRDTFKGAVSGVEDVGQQRVWVGPAIPPKIILGGAWVWIVMCLDSFLSYREDSIVRRQMTLTVITIIRMDQVKNDSETDQADAVHEKVVAAIEELYKTNVGGLVCKMTEDPGAGISIEGLDDKDQFAMAGTSWTIQYERELGTAALA